jgi:CNT family concentrative nucleoside transporter
MPECGGDVTRIDDSTFTASTAMSRLQGLLGIVVVLAIACALSNNRRKIDWRLVIWGLALQFAFAIVILRSPIGQPAFRAINETVNALIGHANEGAAFVFKPLISDYRIVYDVVSDTGADATTSDEAEAEVPNAPPRRITLQNVDSRSVAPMVASVALLILPTVIFFSALSGLMYHLGIMQAVARGIAWVMQKTMKTSGAETLSVAGDIFVGQTESSLLIRPFLKGMTRSELTTVMVGGFATIAGGVYALYVMFLTPTIPDIAGHLIAASVMSAPAALIVAKLIYPETETPETSGVTRIETPRTAGNAMEAFCDGAIEGMKLSINIIAMLLVFVAAVTMVNAILGLLGRQLQIPGLSLQWLLGWLFAPLAWCLGVNWNEAATLGTLLGEKIVMTEFIAYQHLSQIEPGELSERARIIAGYALCGFANFASIGVQIGGIGGLAPERKQDVSALAMRAMIGGALATCMTAAIAGLLL